MQDIPFNCLANLLWCTTSHTASNPILQRHITHQNYVNISATSPNQYHQTMLIPVGTGTDDHDPPRIQQIIQFPTELSFLLLTNNHNNNHNNGILHGNGTQVQPMVPNTTVFSAVPDIECNNNNNITLSKSTNNNITAKETLPIDASQNTQNNGTFQCLMMDKKTDQICNKTFTHRSSLTRHKKSAHYNHKPFKCKFKGCSLSFTRLHLLKLHNRVHSEEKPFKCPDKYCKKAFKQRAHLTEHIRVHTGEKPYTCPFCGTKFRQKFVMDTHKRRHTGERPFRCQLCGKDFSHYTSFWRHKKNKICLKKKK
eukprot:465276_1